MNLLGCVLIIMFAYIHESILMGNKLTYTKSEMIELQIVNFIVGIALTILIGF